MSEPRLGNHGEGHVGDEGWLEEARRWGWLVGIVVLVMVLGYWLWPRIEWISRLRRGSAATQQVNPRTTRVSVSDSRGAPVPGGADVELWSPSQAQPIARATTAFNGIVILELPRERSNWSGLEIVARAGPLVARQRLTGHPGACCTFVLPSVVQLRGRIVPALSSGPTGGWRVSHGTASVATEADGTFRLGVTPRPASPRDPIVITVKGRGATQSRFQVPCPWPDNELVLKMQE